MLQRQGAVDAEGSPVRQPRSAPAPKPKEARVAPREFVREVQGELKKVAWPTRPEVMNYTAVVIATLVVMTLLTFVFDYLFAKGVLYLFDR